MALERVSENMAPGLLDKYVLLYFGPRLRTKNQRGTPLIRKGFHILAEGAKILWNLLLQVFVFAILKIDGGFFRLPQR
jgi:hypothetical protein